MPTLPCAASASNSTTCHSPTHLDAKPSNVLQRAVARVAHAIAPEMQSFLDEDSDSEIAQSPLTEVFDESSSDSSDDECGDPVKYLETVSVDPAMFRARFMNSTGLARRELGKLVSAFRDFNEGYFDIRHNAIKIKGPVVKPLDAAKSRLTIRYQEKYGIHILPATSESTAQDKARVLVGELLRQGDAPFGVIFSPILVDDSHDEINYEGHVIPYLVQRTGEDIHLIELDSAYPDRGVLSKVKAALESQCLDTPQLASCTVHLHQLSFVKVPNRISDMAGRQVDFFSCHTDAIQILKDSLVLHKNLQTPVPIHQLFPDHVPPSQKVPTDGRRFVGLPSDLLRTTQYSVFIDEMGGAGRSAAHRQKYDRQPEEGDMTNYFLLVKALRNATRIAQMRITEQKQGTEPTALT